jgi:hypothetical protein
VPGRVGFSSEDGGYNPVDEEGGAVSGAGGSNPSDLGRSENGGEEWLHAGIVVEGNFATDIHVRMPHFLSRGNSSIIFGTRKNWME